MKNFKKDLACNITLICVLAFTICHLVILTLSMFNVLDITLPKNFSYIWAYILVVLCLTLYIFGFFVANFKKIEFPKWLRIMFYIAFFVFTNVYYILGLQRNIFFYLFMMIYVGFLIDIVSVSIFYNIQKDEKNRLRSSAKYIIVNTLCYAVALSSIFGLLINIIKIAFLPKFIFSTLVMMVAEIGTLVLVSIIVAIIFALSLKYNKVIINACLVKTNNKEIVKKSVKNIQ